MTKYYDNTRLNSFRDCPRMYYLRHIKHWRREGLSKDLAFGLAWHEAMDVVWGNINESPDYIMEQAVHAFTDCWIEHGMKPPNELSLDDIAWLKTKTPGIGYEMIWNYIVQRQEMIQGFEVLEIEKPFVVPLYKDNMEVLYCGRRDKVFRSNGQLIVGEHKTTGMYQKNGPFRQAYIEGWSLDSQVDGYIHSAHMDYPKEHHGGVWVDAALCHKQIHDGFKFIPVNKQTPMLEGWLHDTRSWIQHIEVEQAALEVLPQDAPALNCFPKNTGSCDKWNGCGYRDICRFAANPAQLDMPPEGYMVEKWSPFEKLDLQSIGLPPEE